MDLKAVTTKDQGAGDIKQLSELVSFLVGAFSSPWELSTAMFIVMRSAQAAPRRLRRYGSAAEIGRNIKLIQELHYAVCFSFDLTPWLLL